METKKEAGGIQVGMPFSEFEATVETLLRLKEEGRHFLFLSGPHTLKLIGDVDRLRMNLSKKLGREPLTRRDAERSVDEVITFAQVCLYSGKQTQAVRMLEESVFKDELRKGKDQAVELRKIIANKVDCVLSKLITQSMKERAKRLSKTLGPRLSDVDVDLIYQRDVGGVDASVATPFLRVGLRYLEGSSPGFFFGLPPWVTEVEGGSPRCFELECDETDIDLLVSRLLLAKRLLARTIEEKIERTSAQRAATGEVS